MATVASSPRFTMLAFSCYVSGTGDESHGSGKRVRSLLLLGCCWWRVRPDTQQRWSWCSRTRTGPLRAEMIPIKAAITHEIGRTWVSNRRSSVSPQPASLPSAPALCRHAPQTASGPLGRFDRLCGRLRNHSTSSVLRGVLVGRFRAQLTGPNSVMEMVPRVRGRSRERQGGRGAYDRRAGCLRGVHLHRLLFPTHRPLSNQTDHKEMKNSRCRQGRRKEIESGRSPSSGKR